MIQVGDTVRFLTEIGTVKSIKGNIAIVYFENTGKSSVNLKMLTKIEIRDKV